MVSGLGKSYLMNSVLDNSYLDIYNSWYHKNLIQ